MDNVVEEDFVKQNGQCFVCDKDLSSTSNRNVVLLSNITKYSKTSLPTKIGQLMGDGFMVIVTACDEACSRCFDLLNFMDKLEVDLEKVRCLLTAYLRKKYGLLEVVKHEPSENNEHSGRVDEVTTHRLEEEVNQVLHGKGKAFEVSLDVERKAAVSAENSRICSLLRAAMNARRLVETVSEVKPIPQKFKCRKCGAKLKDPKELRLHERCHLPPSPLRKRTFSCNVCDFKTTSKTEWGNHVQKHVVIKTFKCDVCDKIFDSQKSLDQHSNTHNVYQCADCGAAYELLENLMVHDCMSQTNSEQSLISGSDVKMDHIDENSSVGITVTPDIVTHNSQPSDFDALCRDTLKGETEFSNQLSDGLEHETVSHPDLNDNEVSLPVDEESSRNSEFQPTQGPENPNSTFETPITAVDSDDDFDPDEVENDDAATAEDDDDDDMLEDESESGSFDGEKQCNSKDDKKFEKIFVDGIEVSFSDIVEQETESISPDDLLSEDLYEDSQNNGTIIEKRKVFVCSVCKFRTPDDNSIRKHLETHNITVALECEVCKMRLKTQRTFHKHMKRHLDSLKAPAPANCKICKEMIPDKFGMRKHMMDTHPELFKCQFCDEVCDSFRARQRHEASHSSVSEKTCDVCGKVFRKLSQFQLHQEYAHRDPKCQQCGKEFDTAKKLKDHERRHTQNREGFPCSQCDRVLKTLSGLKLHRAKHTGQYKFCCDVCGRGFMSKAIMEEHMGRHTQEKRYTCDVCGKMFVFNSTMRIHRKWHDNPFPYKCKICGQKFRHTSLLSVHRRRMHTGERPYKCPYCPLTFTVSNCLKRHVVLHTGAYPYFCEPCNKGFTTKQKIAVHLAKVHNNREMLNAKAPPCEYKMVIPNQPGQAPPESDEERAFVNSMEEVEHVEVEHIIVQGEEQHIDADGNIQLQIITMDADTAFSVFE